jgi:hypothetical protein
LSEQVSTLFRLILHAVFTRKLVASIEQRIMLEKALGQAKIGSDLNLPNPNED